jgi:hypothetical protein
MAEEIKSDISNLDPAMVEFLNSCLEEKGIKDVPQDLHDQMVSDLADRLQDWLMQAVFAKLEEKDMPAMDELMEKGADQGEIMEYLQKTIPNIEQIFAAAMQEFKQTYLSA